MRYSKDRIFGWVKIEGSSLLKGLILFSFLSISGCSMLSPAVTTEVVYLEDQKVRWPYRTPEEKIQVFSKRPDTAFVQVAFLDYTAENAELFWGIELIQSEGDALNAIKKEASRLGGDAIIIKRMEEIESLSDADPITNKSYNVPGKLASLVVVIRFRP